MASSRMSQPDRPLVEDDAMELPEIRLSFMPYSRWIPETCPVRLPTSPGLKMVQPITELPVPAMKMESPPVPSKLQPMILVAEQSWSRTPLVLLVAPPTKLQESMNCVPAWSRMHTAVLKMEPPEPPRNSKSQPMIWFSSLDIM